MITLTGFAILSVLLGSLLLFYGFVFAFLMPQDAWTYNVPEERKASVLATAKAIYGGVIPFAGTLFVSLGVCHFLSLA